MSLKSVFKASVAAAVAGLLSACTVVIKVPEGHVGAGKNDSTTDSVRAPAQVEPAQPARRRVEPTRRRPNRPAAPGCRDRVADIGNYQTESLGDHHRILQIPDSPQIFSSVRCPIIDANNPMLNFSFRVNAQELDSALASGKSVAVMFGSAARTDRCLAENGVFYIANPESIENGEVLVSASFSKNQADVLRASHCVVLGHGATPSLG